jgi:hypothetical protein
MPLTFIKLVLGRSVARVVALRNTHVNLVVRVIAFCFSHEKRADPGSSVSPPTEYHNECPPCLLFSVTRQCTHTL